MEQHGENKGFLELEEAKMIAVLNQDLHIKEFFEKYFINVYNNYYYNKIYLFLFKFLN